MKKIIILILCLITSLCITGCKDSEKEEDNYFTLNDVILRKEREAIYEWITMSAIIVYDISKDDYSDLFECKQNGESKIIAGYVDQKTLKKIKDIPVTHPSPNYYIYFISGIDENLTKYQYAVEMGVIDEEISPIKFKYVSEDDITLKEGSKKLVVVLEEYSINAQNIKTNECCEFKIYHKLYGDVSSGIFSAIEKESIEVNYKHFLLSEFDEEIKNNKIYRDVEHSALNVYDNRYIKEFSDHILSYTFGEEYFEIIKETIISEEKNLVPDVEYMYDYKQFLEILKR